MKKSKHSDNEKVKVIKSLEEGMSADILCREYGISRSTLYQWRSKYGGMEVSQVRRLRELEEENRKLKQMYADLALDNKILREVIEKNYRARGKEGDSQGDRGVTRSQHNSGVRTDGDTPFIFLL